MPTVVTEGAASAKGYGFTQAAAAANYIEDVFSTYLYTGNGSTQTITNGIDLSGKGGLVWVKDRTAANPPWLYDTNRGVSSGLQTSNTNAALAVSTAVTAFNSNGFSLGINGNSNTSTNNYASWTFRKQPKFFDVVTYTGTGSGTTQNIPHSLGSQPGMVIIKCATTTTGWIVWHRGTTSGTYLQLNLTNAESSTNNTITFGNNTTTVDPTATHFTIGQSGQVNGVGQTYVAYLFAHNAGGFGLTGTDNVISCGSVTSDVNRDVAVTLGWEPQWVLFKRINAVGDWNITDSMRGLLAAVTGTDQPAAKTLAANAATAENNNEAMGINATGFREGQLGTAGDTYIYIAIRRGPMKTPTDAAKVYNAIARTGTGATAAVTGVGFAPDLVVPKRKTTGGLGTGFYDRLRGRGFVLNSAATDAEVDNSTSMTSFDMDGISVSTDASLTYINTNTVPYINWFLRRAPSFFDEVCYTATNVNNRSVSHNLGVAPELVIFKNRTTATNWLVAANLTASTMDALQLNSTNLATNSAYATTNYLNSRPTSTTITVNSGGGTNNTTTNNFVAYLFATCPGVSKVGSYTGNGTNQTINCGFTAGARFVLIKRTDSTGDWYVWDTARGIVAANDPHLSLNTTAAEVTTDDSVDPDNSGFIVNQLAATNINVNTATYIFLAIA